jgi:phage shock protein A
MFKTLLTLARGKAAAAEEDLTDRNALLILDQQLRDATASLDRAKKSLALSIAQDRQEGARLDHINKQIADLESRVTAALTGGREDLAREGAQAIANLEADRDAATTARSLFATEISRLRMHVQRVESRIGAVDQGRRVARAAEAVRQMRSGRVEESLPHQATLSEAEATLTRLRQRQIESQVADEELERIDASTGPIVAAERLAAEGFGPRLRTTADDVLARLKAGADNRSSAA